MDMSQEDFVIGDISLEGYKVVRGQYFSRLIEPNMSIWHRSVQFNEPAYNALGNCESIQILVHPTERKIVIKPILSKDPEAINWIRDMSRPKSTKLECSMFTKSLYEAWGWDEKLRYRTIGKLVKFDRKLMLLFDFSNPEVWEGMKLVKGNE